MRFRDCSYFLMFRPPSLLASRIAPTAVSFPTGQLRRLHPSRTCVVAFARIGYAIGRLQAINRTGTLTPLDSKFSRLLPIPTAPTSFLFDSTGLAKSARQQAAIRANIVGRSHMKLAALMASRQIFLALALEIPNCSQRIVVSPL